MSEPADYAFTRLDKTLIVVCFAELAVIIAGLMVVAL